MNAVIANAGKDLEYYARVLLAPRIGDGYRHLVDSARSAGWFHEEYLAAVLSRVVSEREASGAALRVKAAKFPSHKTLEEFNFKSPARQRPVSDRSPEHRAVPGRSEKRCLARPSRYRQNAPAIGIATRAAHSGHRVLFDSAAGWVARLAEAHNHGQLASELAKLRRYKVLVVDEVDYIPFGQDSANLFFQLGSSRYERASLILSSNLTFSRRADVFADATIASAMIDRIVHHAEVINLSGNGYRFQGRFKPQTLAQQGNTPRHCFRMAMVAPFSVGVDRLTLTLTPSFADAAQNLILAAAGSFLIVASSASSVTERVV